MIIKNNEKIVFIGDSVTDNDRGRPVGEGFGLGFVGYVRQIDTLLKILYPEQYFNVINMGNVGDTSRDLLKRWQTDVTDLNPDVVCVLIGINDLWRIFDVPASTNLQVKIDEYEQNLREMVKRTKDKSRTMIFMSPFFMEKNLQDDMRKMCDEYRGIVEKVAKENGYLYIDLQKYFDEYLKYRYSGSISWDRVHPSWIGSMIIAKAFLEGVGADRHFLEIK